MFIFHSVFKHVQRGTLEIIVHTVLQTTLNVDVNEKNI